MNTQQHSNMDLFQYKGKRVLVTGASSGLGLDAAQALQAQGATVAILARSTKKLKSATPLKGSMTDFIRVVGDLSDLSSLRVAVQTAIERLEGLDVLVISGGNGKSEYLGLDPEKTESYEFLHRVHVSATLVLVQEALPELIKSKGNVVVISSLAADLPWPQTQAYNASKAGQHGLVKNLAFDHIKQGVRVNCVVPSCIWTDALDVMAAKKGINARVYADKRGRAHPMQRCGEPSEVTKAVLFLASNNMSSYVCGHFLNVDGGLALTNWFNETGMLTVGPEDA